MAIVGTQKLVNNSSVNSVLAGYKSVITDACLDAATKAAFFAAAANDGHNVRVCADAAGATVYPFHVMFWDQAGQKFALRSEIPSMSTILNEIFLVIDDSYLALPADADPTGKHAAHDGFLVWSDDGTEDLTGNLAATENGSPSRTTDIFGNPAGALAMDGVDDFISFDTPPDDMLPDTGVMSITVWAVKPSSGTDNRVHFIHDHANTNNMMAIANPAAYPANSWGVSDHSYDSSLNHEMYGDGVYDGAFESLTHVWDYSVHGNMYSSHGDFFINGVGPQTPDASDSGYGVGTTPTSNLILWGSRNGSKFFNETTFGFRAIKAQKSADYIAAEFANENDPGTFWVGQGYVPNSATPVELSSPCAVDQLATILINVSLPAEYRKALGMLQTLPVEALTPVGELNSLCVDMLAEMFSSQTIGTEHQARLAGIDTVPAAYAAGLDKSVQLLVNQLLDVAQAKQANVDALAGIAATNPLQVAWSGALGVEFTADLPIEWLAPTAWSGSLPAEFTRAAVLSDATPAEYQASNEISAAVPAEQLADMVALDTVPASWSGAMVLEFATEIPIEWLGTVNLGEPVSLENAAVLVTDPTLPTERLADLILSKGIEAEYVAVCATGDLVPVSWAGVAGFVAGITRVFRKGKRGTYFPLRGSRGRGVFFNRRK